jgi:NADH-quinone oxidoreductase subunit J
MIFYFFLLFKWLLIFTALIVVLSRNPIYSILALVLVFCNSSALLLLLGSEFLAFVFIVVYAGAVAVLFLFVIMMINFKTLELNSSSIFTYFPLSAYIIGVLAFEFTFLFSESKSTIIDGSITMVPSYNLWISSLFHVQNIEALGFLLYTHYFFIFIISGLILLVAMLGSIVLTLTNRTNMKRQDIYSQIVRSAQVVRKFN